MKQRIRTALRGAAKWYCKYINGLKGTVSIFLILVLLPFLTIALLLVESARYQSAVELVDELMDCVGLSTLADYDTYLEDRFGLMALSQKSSPATTYPALLKENTQALNNAFKNQSVSVSGVYPLSDKAVFKQQLTEYCEVMAVGEAIYEGINFEDMIKELYKKLGMEDLTNATTAVQTTAEIASTLADVIKAVRDLVEQLDKYNTDKENYEKTRNTFISKVDLLQKELKTAEENLEEDEEEKDIYSKSEVKKAIKAFKTAKTSFYNATVKMAKTVKATKDAVAKIFQKVDKISEKVAKLKKTIDKLGDSNGGQQATKDTADWVIRVADELTNVVYTAFNKSTYDYDMTNEAKSLESQARKIDTVDCSTSVFDYPYLHYYITQNTNKRTVEKDFPIIDLDTIKASTKGKLLVVLNDLDETESGVNEDQRSTLAKLLDIATNILKVQVFYDSSLDANVSSAAFLNATSPSFTDTIIIDAFSRIIQSGKDFIDGITKLNIFKALKGAANFLVATTEFLIGVVTWLTEFTINLVRMVVMGKESLENIMYTAYSIYNLPCRTTYESEKSLSGYSYSKIFTMFNGHKANAFSGLITDLNTLMSKNGGSDAGFRGAEAEYVLVGSCNELLNQCAAFFDLYMFRMGVDAIAILLSKDVKAMASGAAMAAWVVYVVLIIVEPMIDTIFLVNKQDVNLIKKTIYCTPQGMGAFVEKAAKCVGGLSGSTQTAISSAIIGDGSKDDKGLFEMNYQEHLMVLMMVFLSQDKILDRLQNLVQMEAKKNYEGDCAFMLSKSNTMVKATVTGKLNSMFDLKALTESGPFMITTTRYTGY